MHRVAALFTVLLLAPLCARADAGAVFDRFGSAFTGALTADAVWMPALGAAVAVPFDHRIQAFSQNHHPLFGTSAHAQAASDGMKTGLVYAAIVSTVAVPPPDDEGWLKGKALMGADFAGVWFANGAVTGAIKNAAGRERPDHSDRASFPSGHASGAFAMASVADEQIDLAALPAPADLAIDAGLYGTAGLTAWARVEGNKHYASDVLAGAALGNFVSRFVHGLVRPDRAQQLTVTAEPLPDHGWRLELSAGF